MKTKQLIYFLLIPSFFYSNFSHGQNTQEWTENYLGILNYDIKWVENPNQYSVVLEYEATKEEFSNLKPFDEQAFLTDYEKALNKIIPDSLKHIGTLSNEAIEVLSKIMPPSISSYRPKAGDMKIIDEVPIALFSNEWINLCLETKASAYYKKPKDSNNPSSLKPHELRIEIIQGVRKELEGEYKRKKEGFKKDLEVLIDTTTTLQQQQDSIINLIDSTSRIINNNLENEKKRADLKEKIDEYKDQNKSLQQKIKKLNTPNRTSITDLKDTIKALEEKFQTTENNVKSFEAIKTNLEQFIKNDSTVSIYDFLNLITNKDTNLPDSIRNVEDLSKWDDYFLEQSSNVRDTLNKYQDKSKQATDLEQQIENNKKQIENNKKQIKNNEVARENLYYYEWKNGKKTRKSRTSKAATINKLIKDEIKNYKKELKHLKSQLLTNQLKQQKLSKKIDNISPTYIKIFKVDSIEIEFYEGFIENIWVIGHIKGENKVLKFENQTPIPYSNKKAFDRRKSVYLMASDSKDLWTLYLGDLIEYYLQKHENETKDFSPANGTAHWTDFKTVKSLYKKPTAKLFEAHVFSDFIGFDKETPNGLIQTQISKRFNLWTRRFGSFLSKDAIYCNCRGPKWGANWGFFNFVKFSFVFSKFEQKKRDLALNVKNTIINSTLQSIKFASTQKLLQYEVFNVGGKLNFVTLDIPLAISILYLNSGFAYGRTEVLDSTYTYGNNNILAIKENKFGINSIRIFSEIVYKITPQKRYGFETAIRLIWMKGFTDQTDPFLQLNHSEQIKTNYQNININQWMMRFSLLAYFKPDKKNDNRLFFRYYFTGQLNDFDYNFHQLQVGYSFYLTRNTFSQIEGPTHQLDQQLK